MKNILKKAISTYGADLQVLVAIEEMAELQQAIVKLKRAKAKDTTTAEYKKLVLHIAEEIADVKIMLEQLELIFGCDREVACYMEYKIKRLKKRLECDG